MEGEREGGRMGKPLKEMINSEKQKIGQPPPAAQSTQA